MGAVTVITLGCRLNASRKRGDAEPCRCKRRGNRHREHLRRNRRSRAPRTAGDPARAARASQCAPYRHRLLGADRPGPVRHDGGSRSGAGQCGEDAGAEFLDLDAPRIRVNDIALVRETAGHLVAGFEGRARAFLEVQQGCDHACTFCIIPQGRGPNRSVPLGEIVAQARRLSTRRRRRACADRG